MIAELGAAATFTATVVLTTGCALIAPHPPRRPPRPTWARSRTRARYLAHTRTRRRRHP